MVSFVDEHRGAYGVESICSVLPIAPSTYFKHKACQADPGLLSPRAQRDAVLRDHIQRVWRENQEVYGAKKVWTQLNREKIPTARCTVERLMRGLGLRGAVRGRAFKVTTVADDSALRPSDLVNRDFTATRPNQLWVSDLTYVATWRGFVYVAFVIDVFARRIVGWRASSSLRRTWRSTRLNRRSTTAESLMDSYIIVTTACNICPSATRSGSQTQASNHRSEA